MKKSDYLDLIGDSSVRYEYLETTIERFPRIHRRLSAALRVTVDSVED